MKLIIKKEECCGCGSCFQVCPKECISMKTDNEGFVYPIINSMECIDCKLCRVCCPSLENKSKEYISSFAGINLNNEVRLKSSSGGIFSALAEKIIELNGVVVGAAYDDKFFVSHIVIKDKTQLSKIRGSKYIQSNTSFAYKKVKEHLLDGKFVLFSGTECQIAGLKCFLREDFEKLFCVGILCHGVPSPKVWDKYLRENEKKYGIVKNVDFREKSKGWSNYSVQINYNYKEYKEVFHKNEYMKLFLENADLRPSCYSCKYKGIERIADLTLGDAWNIEKITDAFCDNIGTSLIIVHSEKGKRLLEWIQGNVKLIEIEKDFIFQENKDAMYPVKFNDKREKIINNLEKYSFKSLTRKLKDPLFVRIKRKMKKLFKR